MFLSQCSGDWKLIWNQQKDEFNQGCDFAREVQHKGKGEEVKTS